MSLFESLLRVQARDEGRRKRDRKDVPELLNALNSDDPEVQRAAAVAILQVCDTQASDVLTCALSDGCGLLSEAVAEALKRLTDRGAVEPLCDSLMEGCSTIREASARALGELGDPRAIEALRGASEDADDLVREAALEALTRIEAAQAPEAAPTPTAPEAEASVA